MRFQTTLESEFYPVFRSVSTVFAVTDKPPGPVLAVGSVTKTLVIILWFLHISKCT
uniref:Uncharacterized protein n=1 Tax=Arundo donax TaxID=35708 RepID=A0A0A9BSS3_ARUDO